MLVKNIKEQRKKEFEKQCKGFQEFHHATDEEMEFYEYLYKKERRYRTTILILVLICLGLLLSIWM